MLTLRASKFICVECNKLRTIPSDIDELDAPSTTPEVLNIGVFSNAEIEELTAIDIEKTR